MNDVELTIAQAEDMLNEWAARMWGAKREAHYVIREGPIMAQALAGAGVQAWVTAPEVWAVFQSAPFVGKKLLCLFALERDALNLAGRTQGMVAEPYGVLPPGTEWPGTEPAAETED